MRSLLVLAVLVPGFASAGQFGNGGGKFLDGISLRGGYFWGTSFNGTSGRVRIEGPALGADLELYTAPAAISRMSLSGTIIFGGASQSGGDSDANLFRIELMTRSSVVGSPAYLVGGIGLAWVEARGSTSFNEDSKIVTQWGLGYRIGSEYGAKFDGSLEVCVIQGGAAYRGVQAMVRLKF